MCYCVTVLLCYCVTGVTVLMCYCVTVLLCYCVTGVNVLLCYCVTVLLVTVFLPREVTNEGILDARNVNFVIFFGNIDKNNKVLNYQ